MNQIHLSKTFTIDASKYATQGNTILGIRGGGKSYTATKIAEQLMLCKYPILAFDPIGIWHNLAYGIHNPGFPVVVAGKNDYCDVYLTVDNAWDIVKAALETGVSLIIDLFHMDISKKDWKRIVGDCVKRLMHCNEHYGPRHVFIEEGAEFVPQKLSPDVYAVYGAIESMARMGRNVGLGYTLINQRAEEINKAIFEICEMVITHRQSGKNSLTSINDWLKIRGMENQLIVPTLPKLENGECWIIETDNAYRTKVAAKETFHPTSQEKKADPKKVHPADKQAIVEKIKLVLKEEPTNEIIPMMVPDHKARRLLAEIEQLKEQKRELEIANGKLLAENNNLQRIIDNIRTALDSTKVYNGPTNVVFGPATFEKDKQEQEKRLESAKQSFQPAPLVSSKGAADARVLDYVAAFPNGITRKRLAFLAGTSPKKSTFRNALSVNRISGFIREDGDLVFPTDLGKRNARKVEIPEDLTAFWYSKLGANSTAGRMLKVLKHTYPRSLTREQLARSINMDVNVSTFRNGVSVLSTNGLLVKEGKLLKMSDELK